MSQSTDIKVVFDGHPKPEIIHLVFNNDYALAPQIDRWLSANLKGVIGWAFVKEQ